MSISTQIMQAFPPVERGVESSLEEISMGHGLRTWRDRRLVVQHSVQRLVVPCCN
jgi:hypothetical protein